LTRSSGRTEEAQSGEKIKEEREREGKEESAELEES
jgi:hypothetical protein